MTTVYLAGPMTGLPEFNFPAFDEAAASLREFGYTVHSPAENNRANGFDQTGTTGDPQEAIDRGFDKTAAMMWDLARVAESDGIVLLPGWEKSGGVLAELSLAATLGKWAFEYRLWSTFERSLGNRLIWKGQAFPTAKEMLNRRSARLRAAEALESSMEKVVSSLAKPLAFVRSLPDTEHRIRNAATGGEKGSKLARYDLIPARPLEALAEHYGRGAAKYADRNWERGVDWSLNFAAMQRHAWAWWNGEDIDAETGSNHMAAVAWHAFALLEFTTTHPELDNRPNSNQEDQA